METTRDIDLQRSQDEIGPRSPKVSTALKVAYLQFAKCELREGKAAFVTALKKARAEKDVLGEIEAIVGLLRCAGEALDEEAVGRWEKELDGLLEGLSGAVPPMVWYIRGAIATYREDWKAAQRFYLKHFQAARKLDPEVWDRQAGDEYLVTRDHMMARGLAMLAATQMKFGNIQRARFLAESVLARYGERKFRGVNGLIYQILAAYNEITEDYKAAFRYLQKAQGSYMEEHHWYHHLYVLYRYARLARMQQNYPQAYWYLDLVDKAANGPEFAVLRRGVIREREKLEENAVDMLIDSRKGVIRTCENSEISVRKQYVLMEILKALSYAHNQAGDDSERGLSKAEIIERVWQEEYRAKTHDNKLYYNINRLRRLIEPDVKHPKYVLSWKEGYRLAPGLRVHFVGSQASEEGAPPLRRAEDRISEGSKGVVLKRGERIREDRSERRVPGGGRRHAELSGAAEH